MCKILSVVESGTDYKPKARKHFQTIQDFTAIGVVVTARSCAPRST